jgi:hypothetical protein
MRGARGAKNAARNLFICNRIYMIKKMVAASTAREPILNSNSNFFFLTQVKDL